MKRKLALPIGAILCLALLLIPSSAIAGETVTVSIDAPDEVDEDSDFLAKVNVSYVENFDTCGFDVVYDQSVIHVTDVTDGDIGGTTVPVDMWSYIPADTVDTGKIRVATNIAGIIEGVSGTGYLAEIHFDVLGSAGETSTITLDGVGMYDCYGDPIATTTEGDSVHIKEIAPEYYTLTVTISPSGSGSVTLNPDQPTYVAGTPVVLTAEAAATYAFSSWSVDLSGSTNPDSITMNSNKSVTANFVVFSAPANVDVMGADPGVENINVTTKDLGEVDTTNMPEGVEAQEAYVVDSTGTGSFTLRFTDVANASSIVLYKVVDTIWTEIPITAITVIDATTVEVTMEVGDPVLVFGLPTGAPPPPPGVGGTAFPPNKLAILAPWIALGLATIAGSAIFIRRRRARS